MEVYLQDLVKTFMGVLKVSADKTKVLVYEVER